MDRRTWLAVAVVCGAVTLVGITGAAVSGGLNAGVLGGETQQPPALLAFDTTPARCTDDAPGNASLSVIAGGANTEITYVRNISLPGPSYAVGGPTFERQNESTYVLSVPTERTATTPRECAGVARYNASMRIPAGDDPWRIVIQHDGENVTTVYGDSNSSIAGGSASAGSSVSA